MIAEIFRTATLCAFSAACALALDVPDDLIQIINNPRSISEPDDPAKRKSFNVPDDTGAIIEGKGVVSYITLVLDESTKNTKYSFRTYIKAFELEVRGEGELFENYYRVSDPHSEVLHSRVFDRGSKLQIDAGVFTAEWSSSRFIAYDSGNFTVTAGSEEDYEAKINEG